MRWIGRAALGLAAAAGLLAGGLAVYLWLIYSGGADYADLTSTPLTTVEAVLTFDQPIGNAAVARDGRIFFTVHPESRPEGPKLYVWRNGAATPFPAPEVQASLFVTPLGVMVDGRDRVWVIDPGQHGTDAPKLVALDADTGAVLVDHRFNSDIAPWGSFLQDLRISPDGRTIVIADVSFWRRAPGLVVFDVASETARRVLESHPSMIAQNWLIRTATKPMSFYGGLLALKTGVDGVAIDPAGQYVYWASMNHDTLFRAPLAAVADASLAADALAGRVEALGPKPLSDGISTDVMGGVLITDVEQGAVLRRDPSGRLETLVKDARIRWADAVNFGPDGAVYLSDSAIPDLMLMPKDHIAARAPYTIWRFTPAHPGVPGQ